jgi:hypothetical protein
MIKAMGFPDPYIASARPHLPRREYKIVFDRCQMMTHMRKAVDEMRKNEQQVLCPDRTKEKHHSHSRQESTKSSYGNGKELGL